MPRPAKGARLWLRPERRDRNGRLVARSAWIILDGGRHIATGCAPGETRRAEEQLAAHIAEKYRPERRARDIDLIGVADVLAIYLEDCAPNPELDRTTHRRFCGRIERLNEFWGSRPLSDVTAATCREYAARRANRGGARRDLEDLRAAINHHQKEGFHRGVVRVSLPDRGAPRTRWLTRSEAALLLWTCWRYREKQTIHRGDRQGTVVQTDRRPLRHIARFILLGLYTGTRAASIASAAWVRGEGRSWVDLDAGLFYRLQEGRRETNKRQPPAPIPPRLLAHLRRWEAMANGSQEHVVEWNGRPVQSVKTGFGRAAQLAGLGDDVTPHTLRHTAVTWLLQTRASIWETAGFVGMSAEMVQRVYGHHSPDHLAGAARKIGYRHAAAEDSLVISLEGTRKKSGVRL